LSKENRFIRLLQGHKDHKENRVLQDQHNCLVLVKLKEALSQQVQEQRTKPVVTGMKKL
jgi:hypothetical protein